MGSGRDTAEQYWVEYNNLQRVKHRLLRRYLGGWYPILTRYNGKVIYLDTHAGRGRHEGGELGSPVVAIRTLLEHDQRAMILNGSEIVFFLIENDETNVEHLKAEIKGLGPLPEQIKVQIQHNAFESILDQIVKALGGPGFALAPCMIFVDPFGFRLPVDKLARLLQQDKCDMIINVMWRFVDLALHNPKGQEQHLDALFGPGNWHDLAAIEDSHTRCDTSIQRIVNRLGAKHYCVMKMLADNGAIKYVLLHVANNQKAFDLIKVGWALTPEGSLQVRQSDDPNQEFLIESEADLRPLVRILWDQFAGQTVPLSAVYDVVDRSIYKRAHANELLRAWRKSGACDFTGFAGTFAFKKNPTIEFRTRPK